MAGRLTHASPFSSAWIAIIDAAAVGPGTSLLDLGCGDGAFCAFAARHGAVVHGLDVEPDAIARAADVVPDGDFRSGLMEALPWADESFDAVTAFNAFQYALDPGLALADARRVARPAGRIAICKWGPAAQNEFFAFLVSLGVHGVSGDRLPVSDPVEDLIRAARLDVLVTGDVPAPIQLAGQAGLEAALTRAGIRPDPCVGPAGMDITAAAATYRQPDGTYRFDNRLRYWVVRP